MITRRTFLKGLAAALTLPSCAYIKTKPDPSAQEMASNIDGKLDDLLSFNRGDWYTKSQEGEKTVILIPDHHENSTGIDFETYKGILDIVKGHTDKLFMEGVEATAKDPVRSMWDLNTHLYDRTLEEAVEDLKENHRFQYEMITSGMDVSGLEHSYLFRLNDAAREVDRQLSYAKKYPDEADRALGNIDTIKDLYGFPPAPFKDPKGDVKHEQEFPEIDLQNMESVRNYITVYFRNLSNLRSHYAANVLEHSDFDTAAVVMGGLHIPELELILEERDMGYVSIRNHDIDQKVMLYDIAVDMMRD